MGGSYEARICMGMLKTSWMGLDVSLSNTLLYLRLLHTFRVGVSRPSNVAHPVLTEDTVSKSTETPIMISNK